MFYRLPAAVFLSLAMFGCGAEVAHGGVVNSSAVALVITEGSDLLPADLDLVVRFDVGKMRSSLGQETISQLTSRSLGNDEALLQEALKGAEVVFLGLRVADLEAGDRVLVIRQMKRRVGESKDAKPDPISWQEQPTSSDHIVRYAARIPPRRAGIWHIYQLGGRDSVYVSGVEVDSVERVVDAGADPRRGQPEARGLVSVDYRAGKLSTKLQERFPSLASLLGGLSQLRAGLDVTGTDAVLSGRLAFKNEVAGAKALRFLTTIRDTTVQSNSRFEALLGGLRLSLEGSVMRVEWTLSQAALLPLLAGLARAEELGAPEIPDQSRP